MSNAGQAALTVVGTVVGAYFGYPQLGFALGSLAGQALFPTKLPTVSGPKLADFGQTQSSVGAPIPQGWGTCPATGNIIAKSDVREVIQSDEVGGKGGPTQTIETPTYFQDFAIGFNDGEIAGVRRIWANGKLIYDRRPRFDDESDSAFSERMAANALLDEGMVVYFGTEDQEPDPTLEAFYGVGEVSAYRGLAYIVFVNWNNKPEDGNKMPLQWRIEFFTAGTVTTTQGTEYSNEVLYQWQSSGYPENPRNAHTYAIHSIGYGNGTQSPYFETINSVDEGLTVVETYRSVPLRQYQGASATNSLLGGIELNFLDSMGGDSPFTSDKEFIYLHYNTFNATKQGYNTNHPEANPIPSGSSFCPRLDGYLAVGDTIHTDDGFTAVGLFTDTGTKMYMKAALGTSRPQYWVGTLNCTTFLLFESAGCVIEVKRVPRAPDNPCAPLDPDQVVKYLPGTDNFAIVDGELTPCGAWTLDNTTYHVMQSYSNNSNAAPVRYPRNPARPSGHAQYNDRTFWEEAYQEQVALGLMSSGKTYGVHYPVTQSYGYKREMNFDTYETHTVALSDIVRDLCLNAGYDESDFDVTDLSDTLVIGFVRTGPMAARGCIEALRPIAMFDECENEGVITFIRRGKGIVGTVQDEDLGAYYAAEDGADGKPPVSKITTTKLMDYDIPRQVRLHYLSYDRDFDPGQADSPVRTDTDAVQTVDFDTTVVLTDELGSQIVQRIWADFWAGRWQHTIYLDASAHQYKATDCLAVPVDGQYQRMRIGAITDKLPSIRQCELVRDDSAAFISYALGSEPPPQLTEVVTVNSPCDAIMLDLPPLRDQDDDSGIYAVAVPSLAGSTFKGATLMRSVDGGNYDRVANFSSAAVVGTVLIAPDTNADPAVIDRGSQITVTLPAGTLSSATLAEVLAGANAAAIGADGRWEIIQWQEATLFGSTTWTLSGLLRGRRGTEHNVGSTVTGDYFIVLAQAIRVPLDIALVGKSMFYKCVATGTTLESAEAVEFTGQGVALKPFSPSRVIGDRDPNTGLWTIEWLRRGRIGQTMQSGTDIALSEEVEDYEVEILDEDEAAVRTLSVSAETAEYLYNSQLVDFGETPDTLRLNVYQMSTKVGRGYPTFAILHAKQPYVGPPESAPFVAQGGDGTPVVVGYSDGKFIICKRGTKGGVDVVGFYSWPSAGTPTLMGTSYDTTMGGGVPGTYSSQIRNNMQAGMTYPKFVRNNADTAYLINWRYQSAAPPSQQVAANRHMYYTTATGQAPTRLSTATNVITAGDIVALHQNGGTYYAVIAGTPPKVYSSVNGITWTLLGSATGLPNYGIGDSVKVFTFDGSTYIADAFGICRNASNNMLSWSRQDIGLAISEFSSYSLMDVAVNTNAFIVVLEGTKFDGLTYNIIITNAAGSPTTAYARTREIVKTSDVPDGFAFDLEWRNAVPFGGGFAIYGCNPFSGAFPYVLMSPDGISAWTMYQVSNGDSTHGSIIVAAKANTARTRIVATDTLPFVQGGAPAGNIMRFVTSTDGINFTAVPSF